MNLSLFIAQGWAAIRAARQKRKLEDLAVLVEAGVIDSVDTAIELFSLPDLALRDRAAFAELAQRSSWP